MVTENDDLNDKTVSVSDAEKTTETLLQYIAIVETDEETETTDRLIAKTDEEKQIKNMKRLLDAEFRQYINKKGLPNTIRGRVETKIAEMQKFIRDCANEPDAEFLRILRGWKQSRIVPILNGVSPDDLAETFKFPKETV